MNIKIVGIEYRELRSLGYPSFNNKVFGISYTAEVQENETADEVKRTLLEKAMKEVALLHGDSIEGEKVEIKKIRIQETNF